MIACLVCEAEEGVPCVGVAPGMAHLARAGDPPVVAARAKTEEEDEDDVDDEDDDGLRATKPGVCFFCDQPIGARHLPRCVVWSAHVPLVVDYRGERYTWSLRFPVSWSREDIVYYLNHGSFCRGNLTSEIRSSDQLIGPCLSSSRKFCTCDETTVTVDPAWGAAVVESTP